MSGKIKLVTFEWVTYPDNTSGEKINNEGQREFKFEVSSIKLNELLISNNFFNNYYNSLNDFLERYEMEHTVFVYNKLKEVGAL